MTTCVSALSPLDVTTATEEGVKRCHGPRESATLKQSCSAAISDILTSKHAAGFQFSVAALVKRQMLFNQILARMFWWIFGKSEIGETGVVKSLKSWTLCFVESRPSKCRKESSKVVAETEGLHKVKILSQLWPWRHWDSSINGSTGTLWIYLLTWREQKACVNSFYVKILLSGVKLKRKHNDGSYKALAMMSSHCLQWSFSDNVVKSDAGCHPVPPHPSDCWW